MSVCLYRAAEAVLKGQAETIVSFHIQNISNSKAERNTVPLVGRLYLVEGEDGVVCACVCTCMHSLGEGDCLCSEKHVLGWREHCADWVLAICE